MAEPSGSRRIRLRTELPGPPAAVFAALTEPDRLARWWGPHGFSLPEVELALRVGGGYRFAMQPPAGEPFHVQGEFLEVAPPHRLVFTFRYEEPDPDDVETVVTVTLSARGAATRIFVEQEAFATEARRALHEAGWSDSLDRLRTLLAAG
ncbi:SRPBCC domain-containing protein [Egicoccus sp. AB-alg2]|uniref:SRPBCC family protein n=1 Tax=Egicoccus sp. AB-alg2 TaxID=3242693 RepID=UPI00359DFB1F